VSVEHHRQTRGHAGLAAKELADERLERSFKKKNNWRLEGARTANAEGRLEHQRRMQESRETLIAERKAQGDEVRREREMMMHEEMDWASSDLGEKQARVDRVREDTKTEVAAAAAEQFFTSRVRTADTVRNAVSRWREEKEMKHNMFVSAARARVLGTKERGDPKQTLATCRKEEADAMRTSIAHLEARDKMLRLEKKLSKRDHHDQLYDAKYAGTDEAAIVEGSHFESLANAHRDPSGAAYEGVAKQPGSSPAAGRPKWLTAWNSAGWFSWDGGTSPTSA